MFTFWFAADPFFNTIPVRTTWSGHDFFFFFWFLGAVLYIVFCLICKMRAQRRPGCCRLWSTFKPPTEDLPRHVFQMSLVFPQLLIVVFLVSNSQERIARGSLNKQPHCTGAKWTVISLAQPGASAPVRGAIWTHFFLLHSLHTLHIMGEPQLGSCSWSGDAGHGIDVIAVSQTICRL